MINRCKPIPGGRWSCRTRPESCRGWYPQLPERIPSRSWNKKGKLWEHMALQCSKTRGWLEVSNWSATHPPQKNIAMDIHQFLAIYEDFQLPWLPQGNDKNWELPMGLNRLQLYPLAMPHPKLGWSLADQTSIVIVWKISDVWYY